MSHAPRVDILLATFNGAQFLAAQLDSIADQTYANWRIIARDDGSTDGTVDILRGYGATQPSRFLLVSDGEPGLGATRNFARLMARSDADYVMFCDQDDVWLPDKIERLLASMRTLEGEHGRDLPLLVHSDLEVVGPELVVRNPSFWGFQSINPRFGQCLNRLLVQNVVTGCAALFNRSLLDSATPVPEAAMMHDWWVALVAAATGRIGYIPDATVLYRQHDRNVAGARSATLRGVVGRGATRGPVASVTWSRHQIRATRRQAAALLERCGSDLAERPRETVARYAALDQAGFLRRRVTMLGGRYLPNDLAHTLIMLLLA